MYIQDLIFIFLSYFHAPIFYSVKEKCNMDVALQFILFRK